MKDKKALAGQRICRKQGWIMWKCTAPLSCVRISLIKVPDCLSLYNSYTFIFLKLKEYYKNQTHRVSYET